MQKLTKEQAIIISGFTGVLCGEFTDFHKDVEARLFRPAMTHEFASMKFEIKELYRKDFLDIASGLEK